MFDTVGWRRSQTARPHHNSFGITSTYPESVTSIFRQPEEVIHRVSINRRREKVSFRCRCPFWLRCFASCDRVVSIFAGTFSTYVDTFWQIMYCRRFRSAHHRHILDINLAGNHTLAQNRLHPTKQTICIQRVEKETARLTIF